MAQDLAREVEQALNRADLAQKSWAREHPRRRMQRIGRLPGVISLDPMRLVEAIQRPNASNADKLASEVLPLTAACRFTAKTGRRTLAPRTMQAWRGEWWMGRVSVTVQREPWGIVLILAPSNYPLLLPGVQIIQALAAGNAAIVKPAPRCGQVMQLLQEYLAETGIDSELLQVLPESVEAGRQAMRQGVDKVFLTGSVATGRAVLHELVEPVTPCTLELSGCDAAFILPQADLQRAVRCLSYALTLNGGETCIAPRRLFVSRELAPKLIELLKQELAGHAERRFEVSAAALKATHKAVSQAMAGGARVIIGEEPKPATPQPAPSPTGDSSRERAKMSPVVLQGVKPEMEIAQSDLFAPVMSILEFDDLPQAIAADEECPYSLGAAVFGPTTHAEHWARRIRAGSITINDVIVPTADPRAPFGGRHLSGWGVTRGSEGLLEMTCIKTICRRRGSWLPHLDPKLAGDPAMLRGILKLFYGPSTHSRWDGLRQIIQRYRSSNEGGS